MSTNKEGATRIPGEEGKCFRCAWLERFVDQELEKLDGTLMLLRQQAKADEAELQAEYDDLSKNLRHFKRLVVMGELTRACAWLDGQPMPVSNRVPLGLFRLVHGEHYELDREIPVTPAAEFTEVAKHA